MRSSPRCAATPCPAAGHAHLERAPSLEAAVERADAIARSELASAPVGSTATVMLSPAAASFDMFTDYPPVALVREPPAPDYAILVAVVALAAIGILMVYSSSGIRAYVTQDDSFADVGPQLVWAILGIGAMVAAMHIDYRFWRLVSLPLFVGALALLALGLVPSGGTPGGGAGGGGGARGGA